MIHLKHTTAISNPASRAKPRLTTATLLALVMGCHLQSAAAETPIDACAYIAQPGLYRVTQNLNHFVTKQSSECLRIGANDVTLDLGGYSLTGDGTGTSVGVDAQFYSGMSNIEIRNGTIKSFGTGIALIGVKHARIYNVRVLENKGSGIVVGGAAIVSGNTVVGNGSGIATGVGGKGGSSVIGNVTSDNSVHGISVERFSSVRENVANANGSEGLNIECPSLIAENTALDNKSPHLQKNMNLIGSGCKVGASNLAPPIAD